MKLFITGAAGFVGQELLRQCRIQAIEAVAVDIVPASFAGYCQADIRSSDIKKLIPECADAVIHLAGLSRDTDCKGKIYGCLESNCMATLNLMEASAQKKVKQFIFASSEWVYGDSDKYEVKDEDCLIDIRTLVSEYAFSKLISEQSLRLYFTRGSCSVTILRFGIIYGSRRHNWSAVESLFHGVKTRDEIKVGCLKTGRCFVHVSDIASGILKAVGRKGFDIINLGGDKFINLGDVIEISKKILQKDPVIVETNPQVVSMRNISSKKAKMVLNWNPEIDMETGLRNLHAFLL